MFSIWIFLLTDMLLERLLVVIDVYQICWLVETDVECLLPGEDLANVLNTQLQSNQDSALPKYVIHHTWLIIIITIITIIIIINK